MRKICFSFLLLLFILLSDIQIGVSLKASLSKLPPLQENDQAKFLKGAVEDEDVIDSLEEKIPSKEEFENILMESKNNYIYNLLGGLLSIFVKTEKDEIITEIKSTFSSKDGCDSNTLMALYKKKDNSDQLTKIVKKDMKKSSAKVNKGQKDETTENVVFDKNTVSQVLEQWYNQKNKYEKEEKNVKNLKSYLEDSPEYQKAINQILSKKKKKKAIKQYIEDAIEGIDRLLPKDGKEKRTSINVMVSQLYTSLKNQY